MSTLSVFSSPILQRTWICRACIRSQRQTIAQQPQGLWQQRGARLAQDAFTSRIGTTRTFATRANEAIHETAKAAGRSAKSNSNSSSSNSSSSSSSRRRRRLLIIGGGIAIGAAITTVNEDAKHVYVAAQRSYRVVETLVLNIREYVGSPVGW